MILQPLTRVYALDNGLGRVPPMGFNTWNAFNCDIAEHIVLDTVKVVQDLGLDKVGYTYINLDDCWMAHQRDTTTGLYVADPDRFPRGMKFLGDYLHKRNLKFGIYTSAGVKTCAGYPGSLYHEVQDAQTFAEWGVDYLKYDNCYNDGIPGIDRYTAMRDALNATGRPIFFSLCQWGEEESWKWAPAIGNSWRTTQDIAPRWNSIVGNFFKSQQHAERSQPGAWLDPDMLEVGNGKLTLDECKSHFAMWCFVKAPLLLGNDLTKMTSEILAVVSNVNLIGINQDPGTKQATCYVGRCSQSGTQSFSIFATTTGSGVTVALIINWDDKEATATNFTIAGQDVAVVPTPNQAIVVEDLWASTVVGEYDFEGLKTVPVPSIPPHGCAVYSFRSEVREELKSDELAFSLRH